MLALPGCRTPVGSVGMGGGLDDRSTARPRGVRDGHRQRSERRDLRVRRRRGARRRGPFEVFTAWRDRSALKPHVSTFSWDGRGCVSPRVCTSFPTGRRTTSGRSRSSSIPAARASSSSSATGPTWCGCTRCAPRPLLASVCTGSLVLAAAGLLAGRPATTHWDHYDELTEADASILVDTETRFVDDGDVVTSAASPRESTWRCTWSSASRTPRSPRRSGTTCSTWAPEGPHRANVLRRLRAPRSDRHGAPSGRRRP
ncbi:DJ-1/PfpI family protein [Oerskovia sp. M15]